MKIKYRGPKKKLGGGRFGEWANGEEREFSKEDAEVILKADCKSYEGNEKERNFSAADAEAKKVEDAVKSELKPKKKG